ncbi:hypothetical protein [Variovorax boronicumulans]|uniref:hypothetical protein n=1 Tax=Variovorax boronicumulans TaxID=436515 RepID=UPI0033981D58
MKNHVLALAASLATVGIGATAQVALRTPTLGPNHSLNMLQLSSFICGDSNKSDYRPTAEELACTHGVIEMYKVAHFSNHKISKLGEPPKAPPSR